MEHLSHFFTSPLLCYFLDMVVMVAHLEKLINESQLCIILRISSIKLLPLQLLHSPFIQRLFLVEETPNATTSIGSSGNSSGTTPFLICLWWDLKATRNFPKEKNDISRLPENDLPRTFLIQLLTVRDN